MMGNIGVLMTRVKEFDWESLNKKQLKALKPMMEDPDFRYDRQMKISRAAAILVGWMRQVYSFSLAA